MPPGNDPKHGEDVTLLRSQSAALPRDPHAADQPVVARARRILPALPLTSSGRGGHRALSRLRHRDRASTPASASAPSRSGAAIRAIIHGLGNLVENAVDFAARERHRRSRSWDDADVTFTDHRRRPRLPAEIIDRIGEPYMSTAPGADGEARAGGLGLGLFIAKTLLERSGATLDLRQFEPASARAPWSDFVAARALMDVDLGRVRPPDGNHRRLNDLDDGGQDPISAVQIERSRNLETHDRRRKYWRTWLEGRGHVAADRR